MTENKREREPPLSNGDPRNVGPVETLLDTLLMDYDFLKGRLTAYTGSAEQAADILQDVYLKLRSDPQIGEVRLPRSYLYRMALNLAKNQRRNGSRWVAVDDMVILALPDEAPDPERVVLASDEMRRAIEYLHRVPARQRAIFLARWRDEKSQIEIASEFGIHKRTVQKELERAERYLRKKLGLPNAR